MFASGLIAVCTLIKHTHDPGCVAGTARHHPQKHVIPNGVIKVLKSRKLTSFEFDDADLFSSSHFGKLRALSALTGKGSGSKTVAPGDRFAP
jgi:hypothetical protein